MILLWRVGFKSLQWLANKASVKASVFLCWLPRVSDHSINAILSWRTELHYMGLVFLEALLFLLIWPRKTKRKGDRIVGNKFLVTVGFFFFFFPRCKSRRIFEDILKRIGCLLWLFYKHCLPSYFLFTIVFGMLFCMYENRDFFFFFIIQLSS